MELFNALWNIFFKVGWIKEQLNALWKIKARLPGTQCLFFILRYQQPQFQWIYICITYVQWLLYFNMAALTETTINVIAWLHLSLEGVAIYIFDTKFLYAIIIYEFINFLTSLQYVIAGVWSQCGDLYTFVFNMCPSCCVGIGILSAATVNRSTMPVCCHDSPKSVRKSCSFVAFVASVMSLLLICRSLIGHYAFSLRNSSLILQWWKEQRWCRC